MDENKYSDDENGYDDEDEHDDSDFLKNDGQLRI